MGNSYIKMRVTNTTGGFAYEYPSGKYKKVIVSAHPDNKHKRNSDISYNSYYKYGDWFYYDGNARGFNRVISEYDPQTQGIDYLIDRLKVECSIERYETTMEMFNRWKNNILEAAQKIPTVVTNMVLGYTLGSLLGWSAASETVGDAVGEAAQTVLV